MNTDDIREIISNAILKDIQDEIDRRFILRVNTVYENPGIQCFDTLKQALDHVKTRATNQLAIVVNTNE